MYLTNKTDVYIPYSGRKTVSLDTVRGVFVLKFDEAEDMATLVEYHMDGLRQRSVYALAQKDFSKPGKICNMQSKG